VFKVNLKPMDELIEFTMKAGPDFLDKEERRYFKRLKWLFQRLISDGMKLQGQDEDGFLIFK
jgi:hypothetical protein